MSEINLDKVSKANLEELQIISKKTFLESFAEQNSEEDMHKYLEEKFSLENILIELNEKNSEFYLAKIRNQVTGYLKINFKEAQTELKEPEGMEIERIYVLSESTGRGIGQILLNRALERAKSKKCKYAWLGVWEKNPGAIRFYNKNEFYEFDTHIFVLGEDAQTDIMMKKLLE